MEIFKTILGFLLVGVLLLMAGTAVNFISRGLHLHFGLPKAFSIPSAIAIVMAICAADYHLRRFCANGWRLTRSRKKLDHKR